MPHFITCYAQLNTSKQDTKKCNLAFLQTKKNNDISNDLIASISLAFQHICIYSYLR